MKSSPLVLPLTAAAMLIAAAVGTAQIERLDLGQMTTRTDNVVFGTIVDRQVIRIDHPKDGPELYFTTLTIEGTSLRSTAAGGETLTIDVTFAGGFVDAEHGVHNSEAPADEDVKIGNRVVAFSKWTENMGGDLAGNALYASHGGLYRTFENRGRTIVQGRGEGYAIPVNVELPRLTRDVRAILDGPQPR